MVGLVGLEPTTPALSRRCSNQLSYRPIAFREKRMDPGDARYATYSSICGLLIVGELAAQTCVSRCVFNNSR
jgi:hypothetical protein